MKKINWKDFKIKDEQPNLIEGGWDSFKPVGNIGEETKAPDDVFNENYFPNVVFNGDFSTNEHWQIIPEDGDTSITNNRIQIGGGGVVGVLQQPTNPSINTGDLYYICITISNYDSGSLRLPSFYFDVIEQDRLSGNGQRSALYKYKRATFSTAVSHDLESEMDIESIYVVNLSKMFGHGREPTKDWCDNNLRYYANWEDIPIENKNVTAWDNMAIRMTSLDNELTRVQTWGGSENVKMRFIQNSENVGEPLNFSMYIENNGDDISLHHDAPSTNDAIEKGYKGFFETQTEVSVGKYKYIGIGTEGNLDFIASEPQFVEGDKSNPVLIINELEDGREHVQVHGVKNDTKLISPKIEGISGELYQIKTNIENSGIEMSMDSTLGDKSIGVGKGENSVSHTGELQGQHIIIELGAKYE